MSLITISDLNFIKPQTLASLLSSPDTASKTAIIDVRDNDHIGGHIKGSTWVPVDQLDLRIPELLRLNKDRDKVVFHCMLSQQRGPSSALKYMRAAAAQREKERKATSIEGGEEQQTRGPEVCVLEGGFNSWQARYGKDEKLTESYAKDLWE